MNMNTNRIEELLEQLGRQMPPEYSLSSEIRDKLLQQMHDDARNQTGQTGDADQMNEQGE